MDPSHLSNPSQRLAPSDRPTSPTSLNYVSANTFAAPRSPLRSVTRAASTHKIGRRVLFRTKAKKAFTSVKKSVKMVARLCRPSSGSSGASFGDLKRSTSRLSMRPATTVRPRASTPSICLTRPTHRGVNVRLSIHQVPPTPQPSQTFTPRRVERPDSGNGRKSMRFVHPVVSGVIAGEAVSRGASTAASISSWETIEEEGQYSSIPGTPTTIATADFENQVNPKRVFRRSHVSASFTTFKDVMDGVKPRPAPAEAAAQTAATPPTLPYIAMSPAMNLNTDGNDAPASLAALAAQLQAQYVLPATEHAPAVIVVSHPPTLTPGQQQAPSPSASKPRTTAPRPHTTGEMIPGSVLLPYIPYNPSFNPYNASTPALSTHSLTSHNHQSSTSNHSSNDLASGFAEAEAAEQLARNKRHSTLYEAVESGLFPSSPILPTPAVHQIKRKPVPVPVVTPPPAEAGASTAVSQTGRNKPLPALPAHDSPRRFTQGVVPEALSMNDNGYPIVGGRAEGGKGKGKGKGKCKSKGEGKSEGQDEGLLRRARTVRAVEGALGKLLL